MTRGIAMRWTRRNSGSGAARVGRGGRQPARAFRRWFTLLCASAIAVAGAVLLPAVTAYAAPSSWSGVSSTNQGAGSNDLTDVACASAANCMAVGGYTNSSGNGQTLAESWNGTSWKVLTTPDPGTTGNQFNSVSCPSTTRCIAVGGFVNGSGAIVTLIALWNGSTWSLQSSPNPSTSVNHLAGVSCASTTNCQAVGDFDNGTTNVTLVESWNGSTWSVKTSPSKGTFTFLNGVSCTSTSNCMAVGRFISSSGDFTLAEKWNGTAWSIVPTPNPGGSNDFELLRVSCATGSACMAVGDFFSSGVTETLTEKWNGSTWTHVTSPSPSGTDNDLFGVSCAAANNCAAVGDQESGSATLTLNESWNGSSWSVKTSPSPSGSQNGLTGVACASTSACLAVGGYSPGSAGQTLAEFWNGSAWSFVISPDQGSSFNALSSVSCTAAPNCMAAGFYANGSGTDQTLIESWNGTAWSVIPSPDAGTGGNVLAGISCSSASSCVAVGFHANGTSTSTLALVWNGSTWSLTSSPSPGVDGNTLNDVSCVSATSCVAVGSDQNGATLSTLSERWNGSTWTTTASPDP
ncbi:MAG TPA: hypothetical protein VGI74_26315, partial [Streptosporangiaceae bacterium]